MATEDDVVSKIAALERQLAELRAAQNANVSGSGAVAQGGGVAIGERGVKIDGSNPAHGR